MNACVGSWDALPSGVISPGFDRPADVRVWVPGEWAMLATLVYVALDGSRYEIPERFISDFASIPRLLRAVYATDDEVRAPSLLHDWLYCSKLVTRARADELFREAMTRAGTGYFKRNSMYAGVRSGGWVYWNKRDGLTCEDFVNV